MKIVEVSVPTKVTLFGEHAVVYGKPAIAIAIPRRIVLRGSASTSPGLRIRLSNVRVEIRSVRIDGSTEVEVDVDELRRILSYVVKGFEIACRDEVKGLDLEIRSDLPIGVGLGTSAAVSVGMAALCLALRGYEGSELVEEAAHLGWRIEREVQGAASPMDTFTVAYGGVRFIEPWIPRAVALDHGDLPLIVGYTPKRFTTAQLVAEVRKLRESYPQILNPVIELVGLVVEEARKAIERNDLEKLGELMVLNHRLLHVLGVVSLETEKIVRTVLEMGALGAKMSGAGGGGAFVVLAKDRRDVDKLSNVVEALGGRIVATSIEESGLKVFSG